MAEIRFVIGELKAPQGLEDLEEKIEQLARRNLPTEPVAFRKILGCQGVAIAAAAGVTAAFASGRFGWLVGALTERAAEEERRRHEERVRAAVNQSGVK